MWKDVSICQSQVHYKNNNQRLILHIVQFHFQQNYQYLLSHLQVKNVTAAGRELRTT